MRSTSTQGPQRTLLSIPSSVGPHDRVYEDEEIANDLKRTEYVTFQDGLLPRQVVEETSALYGIPEECVAEVVTAVLA